MQGSTLFVTSHGSNGFVNARVKERMKGASFVWTRAGLPPADGSRFEIRPKSGSSVLDPPIPAGVDEIRAIATESENAEKIAAVPGIDALLMGTNDLCLEMGIPGQLDNERVVAAIDTVIAACKKHGKWPGLGGVYGKELLKRYIARGMRLILAGNDISWLLNAAQEQAGFVRACE